jgi:hypothetical protein
MATLDSASRTFQHALEQARRSDRDANADIESGYVSKLRVRTPVEFGRAEGGGGDARWGLAMTWTNEPEAMTSAPTASQTCEPARLETDMVEAIASALGVGAGLTESQLTRRWRAFVWRDHPDRQPVHARERANIRVAIANTLYDHARRELKRAR